MVLVAPLVANGKCEDKAPTYCSGIVKKEADASAIICSKTTHAVKVGNHTHSHHGHATDRHTRNDHHTVGRTSVRVFLYEGRPAESDRAVCQSGLGGQRILSLDPRRSRHEDRAFEALKAASPTAQDMSKAISWRSSRQMNGIYLRGGSTRKSPSRIGHARPKLRR